MLKDFKGKAGIHVEWVKAWLQCLAELQAYVKQFHTTGLSSVLFKDAWSLVSGTVYLVFGFWFETLLCQAWCGLRLVVTPLLSPENQPRAR